MNRFARPFLPVALPALALLLVAAGPAGAESSSAAEAGKGGPIEATPDAESKPSPVPPQSAPDRPQTQPKPEESPVPDRGKSEGEAQPETKPEVGAPPKNLKPIAPEEAVGILGKKVHGPAGEDMGMIVDVLVDGDSRPRAAVIDFGGFLGVGSRKIAIDWELLQFRPADRTQPVHLVLGRTEVQASPEYKPSGQPAEIIAPTPPTDVPAPPDAEK